MDTWFTHTDIIEKMQEYRSQPEIRKLKKEVADLKVERDFLKKSDGTHRLAISVRTSMNSSLNN